MKIEEYIPVIDRELTESIPQIEGEHSAVADMMRYCLENGGKRVRPYLVLEFCRICGGNFKKALPVAAAIEFLHTYSLVHDDLPCMDDSDTRRGRPSAHVKFGEANALLCGDALLTESFGLIASAEIPPYAAVRCVSELSWLAGADGMVGGQYRDLLNESRECSAKDMISTEELKTCALIRAACCMGCYCAGADSDRCDAADGFGHDLGLAFQIRDDILDVTADPEILGKPVGGDEQNQKITYVSILGLEKAQAEVERLTTSAIRRLGVFGAAADDLRAFAGMLAKRDH
ncbi:MAG: polyprenyl synthetase family protein [Clostridia bacterium]|nr:polyprenyl synthetase family protein [Clostridia bacterium]